MKVEERKEVVRKTIEAVIVGRKCDVCGADIMPVKGPNVFTQYNYFVIHTHHHDWGNDSVDSHEYFDACCPECVMKFTNEYIKDAYDRMFNSHEIEIIHVRSLENGVWEE